MKKHKIVPSSKGLIQAMKESESMSYSTSFSSEDMVKFLKSTIKSGERELMIYGSENASKIITASLRGDNAKVKEIQERISADIRKSLKKQYDKIYSKYGVEVSSVVEQLDSMYKRNHYDNRFVWDIRVDWLDDEDEYYTCSYNAQMVNGVFVLYKVLEDETGYDIKRVELSSGITHDNVLNEINKL